MNFAYHEKLMTSTKRVILGTNICIFFKLCTNYFNLRINLKFLTSSDFMVEVKKFIKDLFRILSNIYDGAQMHCTKKLSFPLRTFPVNVTKSAVSWRFGHIYWRNPLWKTSFFVQWCLTEPCNTVKPVRAVKATAFFNSINCLTV